MRIQFAGAILLLFVPTRLLAQEPQNPTSSSQSPASQTPESKTDTEEKQAMRIPGGGLVRVPHVGEVDLTVKLDENDSEQVHARLYGSVDPAIKTLYYLPEFAQLDRRVTKYSEREAGKIIYSFWVGIPKGFDAARKPERYTLGERAGLARHKKMSQTETQGIK